MTNPHNQPTDLLMQVEAGLCEGAVLYHAHVSKSKAETSAQQAAKDEAAKLKRERRQQQEENVRRKEVGAVETDPLTGSGVARQGAKSDVMLTFCDVNGLCVLRLRMYAAAAACAFR